VQPVTIAEVADTLYGLPPAEFTAARDERAREVRAAGQRDEAAAIRKLARPTASAWLVNQLTRTAPDQLSRLTEVGEALGEAQRTLAGDRLRELSAERRQVITELLAAVADVAAGAGQPASAVVMGEVRATLEAALADTGARAAVLSGRLTKALTYAGIGEVDLSAAVALPAEARTTRAGSSRASAKAAHGEASQARTGSAGKPGESVASGTAADALAEAQAAAAQAEQGEAAAEQRLTSVTEQRQFLQRRISHLERELRQAKDEDGQLAREARQAHRDRDAAARALETARRKLAAVQRSPEGRSPRK
jgi:hypothetical protein